MYCYTHFSALISAAKIHFSADISKELLHFSACN